MIVIIMTDIYYRCFCRREFITYKRLIRLRWSCFLGEVTDTKNLFMDTLEENSNDMIENKVKIYI